MLCPEHASHFKEGVVLTDFQKSMGGHGLVFAKQMGGKSFKTLVSMKTQQGKSCQPHWDRMART